MIFNVKDDSWLEPTKINIQHFKELKKIFVITDDQINSLIKDDFLRLPGITIWVREDDFKKHQTKMKVLIQSLRADSDINGNARRLYLIMDLDGVIIEAIDEGCLGSAAYKKYSDYVILPIVDISVSEYKRYLKKYQIEEA